MADADGDQFHRAARFDMADGSAQMPLEIIAAVHRQGRIVHRSAVRDHHQDAAVFRAGKQPVMCPQQRLAVDILLQQALAHHQAEIFPGAPPRCIGLLVNDVPQIVEPSGLGRPAGRQPRLAALAALPGPGGEAQDLGLHCAALQRAGEDVGADGGDRDRAAAHGARIVDQQRHHRVAKLGVALDLVR